MPSGHELMWLDDLDELPAPLVRQIEEELARREFVPVIRNLDVIATDVNRLAREGVSTTTMGVGDDYNEDLMEAMARSGDGNYYYIESPKQLADIFQTELMGLMATFSNTVSLGIEPASGVTLADVLNDLDRLPTGRLKLLNLVSGMPIIVVVRLNVPPAVEERELCRFRLAWNTPHQADGKNLTVSLRLPAVDAATWDKLAETLEVRKRAALLLMARCKKAATRSLKQGDFDGAKHWLVEARQLLASAPDTPEMSRRSKHWRKSRNILPAAPGTSFISMPSISAHLRRRSTPYRK